MLIWEATDTKYPQIEATVSYDMEQNMFIVSVRHESLTLERTEGFKPTNNPLEGIHKQDIRTAERLATNLSNEILAELDAMGTNVFGD